MSEVAIRVENLTKIYHLYDDPIDRLKESLHPLRKKYHRDYYALKDVSFEVKKGETVGIIGRNGAGKSTLLKILTGVLTPTSGQIEVNGRVLALLELGTGFNPELTGLENIYFNGALLGASREEMEQKLDAILDFADIGDFVHQPVKTYSSGMLVRLAFAVIANMDPDILIVDEALAVGDAFFVQKCMRFIRRFQGNGGTLLFVSHDTGAVVNLCNKAILLKHGSIVKEGTPKKVLDYYLAMTYEGEQKIDGFSLSVADFSENKKENACEYRDMRSSFINSSVLRNDIEVFCFNPEQESFGTGDAEVKSVRILDKEGVPLSWVVGGEDVVLEIQCLAYKDIHLPIVGFVIKDRLGQVVFSDNTYLVFRDNPVCVHSGETLVARFEFHLPVLPTGDYTISPAIAEGTQDKHVQHHWLHDAMVLKVHASSVVMGLVGLSMRKISMEIK